jgi:hypothetical protein
MGSWLLLSLLILDERQVLREERWCGAHHTDARAAYRSDERHLKMFSLCVVMSSVTVAALEFA